MPNALAVISRPQSERLEDLSVEQLTSKWKSERDQAVIYSKRTTGHVWKAGRLLWHVKAKTEPVGKWESWLAAQSYPKTTAWQDLKLFQFFGSEDEAAKYPITEAKIKAGCVQKPRKASERSERREKPKEAPNTPTEDLDALNGFLERLQGEEIKWGEPLARRWLKAARLFRSIDSRLAVEAYGYYATAPSDLEVLLAHETFSGPILEPCSGDGAIARILEKRGYEVRASDIRSGERVYGSQGVDAFDYRKATNVVTNPPWLQAIELAEHFLKFATGKVALLLPCTSEWSTKGRALVKKYRPSKRIMLPKRPVFLRNGDEPIVSKSDCVWVVWEAGFAGKCETIHG
jgi:hypothetical protein